MVQSPSWDVNWFAASQEIPRISRNPKVHYRTHKRPPPVYIPGQPNPVHMPTSHLLEIHPNIIHPSTPRSLQWCLSIRFPPLLTHTRHMPSPFQTVLEPLNVCWNFAFEGTWQIWFVITYHLWRGERCVFSGITEFELWFFPLYVYLHVFWKDGRIFVISFGYLVTLYQLQTNWQCACSTKFQFGVNRKWALDPSCLQVVFWDSPVKAEGIDNDRKYDSGTRLEFQLSLFPVQLTRTATERRFCAVLKMTAVVLISVLLICIAKGIFDWKGNDELKRIRQKKGPKSYDDNCGYLHKDMTVWPWSMNLFNFSP